MEGILLVGLLAALFYSVVPGVGAFIVRYHWRTFRRRVIAGSMLPRAGYLQMRHTTDLTDGAYLGNFRFVGSLEAIQGNDVIWLNDGTVSFSVDMKGQTVALLPSGRGDSGSPALRGGLIDESSHLVPWRKLSHLTEGVRILAMGGFYAEAGRGLFRGPSGNPLTVVMFGGRDDTMLRRAVWSGRQRNEYWNQLTPASLAAGALSLLTAAFVYLRAPGSRFEGLLAVTLALVPILPLFPPGVVLFFLYRNLWRRGRFLRAERDIIGLPARFHGDAVPLTQPVELPSGERYAGARITADEVQEYVRHGAHVQELSDAAQALSDRGEFFVFGALRSDGDVGPAKDPLAEFVVVPGDPGVLAARCNKQARRLEVLAAALVTFGIAANLYLALLLVSNLLR